MAVQVLIEDQKRVLRRLSGEVASWRNEEDLARRREVAAECQRRVQASGLATGEVLSKRQLCELVGLQWQIQNLNPLSLPKFVGSSAYKAHLGATTHSFDDFLAEPGPGAAGSVLNDDADLARVSSAVRLMATNDRSQQARGASMLLALDGAGQAITSGFLHLLHPSRYGLVNTPTKAPFSKGGRLEVSDAQRLKARQVSEVSFPQGDQISKQALMKVFRWQIFLSEVLETCQFEDFHEVDQFLWTLASASDSADSNDRITKALNAITTPNIEARRRAEAEATQLINDNLGKLSGDQLRRVFNLINTCVGRNGLNYTRFGPAFVGQNANLLVDQLDVLNPFIAEIWQAPEERIPALLNQFWQRSPAGGGRSFPTAILYLRDPQKYVVWTPNLERALYSVTPGLPARISSSFSYRQYCRGVQHLRQRFNFPVELQDFVLSRLIQPRSAPQPPPPTGDFKGVSKETFLFMEELATHNNSTWFNENRTRFKEFVDAPLRALFADLGEEIITPLDPDLETSPKSNKCIARIVKNNYGRAGEGPYYEYFWGAFYRRDRSKPKDAQLFITIHGDALHHGLYIGDQADDVRKQLADNVSQRPEVAKQIFETLKSAGFIFASCTGSQGNPEPVEVANYESFASLITCGQFQIFRLATSADAIAAGVGVKAAIGKDFQLLHPLFRFATVKDPTLTNLPVIDLPDDELSDPAITIDDLVKRTFLEEEFFDRLNNCLRDKSQLVFCGPPGTGKTHVAIEYAKYLAQGAEVDTVQFHPSYGYEDFIEGLRPVASETGGLSYSIVDGVFKRLCDRARNDSGNKYVLVIDEINRGNIPRIFGELLFLLERRDQTTILPYSQKRFSVPRNVIILGTMNSSDRSIALMDLALRRRFHFIEMQPRGDVLRAWLNAHGKPPSVCSVFERLNEKLRHAGIEDDRLVGHAHFMSSSQDGQYLEHIWMGTIGPLLREYFYAEPERMNEFRIEQFEDVMNEEGDDDETDDVTAPVAAEEP